MLILTIVQLDITLKFFFFSYYFVYTSACNLVSVFVRVIAVKGYSECMQRRCQVELLPLDLEPERTLLRLHRDKEKHIKEI